MSVLLFKEIDLDKVSYGAVKTLPSGGKSIAVTYNGKPILAQTPRMRSPFNLTNWDENNKKRDGGGADKSADIEVKKDAKYDLQLSFDNKDNNVNLDLFQAKVAAWDDAVIMSALENGMNWLGKKYTSKEVVEELYTPMLKPARDPKYAPTFKLTVPFRNGKFDCKCYTSASQEVDMSTINFAGAHVTAIIQCVGIWVVGKKFGVSWRAQQLKVETRSSIPNFAFREVEGEAPLVASDDEDTPAAEADVHVEDSDDELNRK